MKPIKFFTAMMLAFLLAACGGGSPNVTGAGSGTGGAGSTVGGPDFVSGTLALALVRADGSAVSDGKVSQTGEFFLMATVKDSSGSNVNRARVTFEIDSVAASLVPLNGVALSSSGVARVKVSPASVSSLGVVTAKATVTINGKALNQEIFLEIAPGTVELLNVTVAPLSVQAGQSVVASVEVLVNGVPAASNSVAVAFTSNCGSVSPTSALVNAAGRATVVVQTSGTGACSVTASYTSVSRSANYTVSARPITGIEFISVIPERIYQDGSTGVKTSTVSFKVVNDQGIGVPSTPVSAVLTNTDGGINFCGSSFSGVNSDVNGVVTFSVCSGVLPATVQVRASLDGITPIVATESNILTVQTGAPTQRFFDISATHLNFYAGGQFTNRFNGNETEITVFAADRQGNPVPSGTPIVFVSEGGQLIAAGSSSCLIGADGRCSVKLIGQAYRPLGSSVGDPRPGRVTILAYADGEESFIDSNNNNRYDPGESFEDLGNPFIDKDENGIFSSSYTNLVAVTNESESFYPIGSPGNIACPSNSNVGLSVPGTCNGTWNGSSKVRRSIAVVFSGDEIGGPDGYDASIPIDKRTTIISSIRSRILVRISDLNGNPLPSTTSLSVSLPGNTGTCAATLRGSLVGNTTEPTKHQIDLDQCSGGETVLLKATYLTKESFLSMTVQ